MTNRDELAQDLLECFEDFQVNAPQPGGSTAANKYVADKLADAIADGIDRGAGRSWQGKATAEQLNAIPLEDRHGGDMWLCTDGGTLNGQTPITVPPNTVVIWNGDSWSEFIHVDLSAYATKAETVAMVSVEASLRSAGDAALQGSIDSHTSRTDNPHQVTAAQVGAATASDISSAIAAHNTSGSAHNDIREGLATEIADRTDADAEIITSLEDETTARRLNDELLAQQIDEVAVQTDWNEDDSNSLAFLKNRPSAISNLEIEALFI